MRVIPLFASALLLASPPARAHETSVEGRYFKTGNALLGECKKEGLFCDGYIAGVADAHRAVSHSFREMTRYCTPEHVTVHELRRVVVRWLQANPGQIHFAASSLVVQALHDAFPCEEKK
jgi:hypothetical protein